MYKNLDLSKFSDARFWAAVTCAFFGLLRVGEYTNKNLLLKHVTFTDEGTILSIPYSKTDLRPVDVRLAIRSDELCPTRALRHYLSFLHAADGNTPLFVGDRGGALTDRLFIAQLKLAAAWVGLDPSHIAGHSLRRGGCTALFLAGVSEAFIAAHGRWRSMAFRGYLDFVAATQWLPTRELAKYGSNLPSREAAAQLLRLPGAGIPGRR